LRCAETGGGENPDTQNTTDSKHGLTVQLVSLASVQPREAVQEALAATDVPTTYHTILDAANSAHARILTAQLNEQDKQNVSGQIDIEVMRTELDGVDKVVTGAVIRSREMFRARRMRRTQWTARCCFD